MNIQKIGARLIVLIVFAVVPSLGFAQITSVADAIVQTAYSSGNQDNIYIFCSQKRGDTNATLTAISPNGDPASFVWQKYNVTSGNFDSYLSDQSGNKTSIISNLQDGCYMVTITTTSGVKTTYTAWVFNNYIGAKAEIKDSNCNSFTLEGTLNSPTILAYVDINQVNRPQIVLNKGIQVKWMEGNTVLSRVITSKVYSPPTKDTGYTLEVSDKFGCVFDTVVQYVSIAIKASFTYTLEDQKKSHPNKKEAPLTVTFTNTSENADPSKYIWYIYRDLDEMKREAGANQGVVKDSILTRIYTEGPIYVFEKPGSYKVKLVAKNNTCSDSVYIDDYITIDASFIEAPNVFTPNDDGNNDKFVVRFFSMKSVKISIFNRWGKMLHVWESNNVQGFGPTVESVPQAVWDGKVGGKLATPGVYYYVVEGIGRDDKRQRASGFFHLFRGK